MHYSEPFQFNRELDHAYLDQLYEGDLDYAIDMFDSFLEYSLPVFYALPDLLEQRRFEALQNDVHRLKPAFPMVGLSLLTPTLQQIEQAAGKPVDPDRARAGIEEGGRIFDRFLPLIKSELARMKAIAEGSHAEKSQ